MPVRPPASHRPGSLAAAVPRLAIYERLAGHLRQRIAEGEWRPGVRLPGRHELARAYEVNLLTVQRAVRLLAAEGILGARPRQGTFVRRRPALAAAPAGGRLAVLARLPAVSPETPAMAWAGGVVAGIEAAAGEAGAPVRVIDLPDIAGAPDWRRALAAAAALAPGAVILVHQAAEPVDAAALAAALAAHPLPAVLVGWGAVDLPLPQVVWDQHEAGRQAAAHLIAGGWRGLRIFCPFAARWAEERWQGVAAAARAAGLRPPPAPRTGEAFPADPWRVHALALPAARAFIAGGGLRPGPAGAPAGVVAGTDGMALALRDAARAAGLAMGRDFALVGVDDIPAACRHGLTSLRPPVEDLGRLAAAVALGRLPGRPSLVRLPLRLCARISTRPWA